MCGYRPVVCLLVVRSRIDPGRPLVVAANRDERYERPAVALAVLRQAGPRVLGGRDLLAGGTWLAVNEHGVVAGLTNRPSPSGRNPAKRSRGELPLALALHPSAAEAVAHLAERYSPEEFNPCWLLVGDRRSLYSVDMTAGKRAAVAELPPGLFVLENRPLTEPSAKVDHVRRRLARAEAGDLWALLSSLLADHTVPPEAAGEPGGTNPGARPAALSACCVHTDGYGTRSSAIIVVPEDETALPALWVADGPPCQHPLGDRTAWWTEAGARGQTEG